MRLPHLLLGALALLAACRSAPSAARPTPPLDAVYTRCDASPQTALTSIRLAALDRGWRISDEGPDFLIVDFGTTTAPLPGAAGRTTDVKGSGLYHVSARRPGTEITLFSAVRYWQPDERQWLAAPEGFSPGPDLLAAAAR